MHFQHFVTPFKTLRIFFFLLGQYALPSFSQNEAANWPLGPVAGLTFQMVICSFIPMELVFGIKHTTLCPMATA
jgi:hypothetical protein